MLYLNHTDLLDYIFRVLSVPVDMRAGLWRHFAEACETPVAVPLRPSQHQQQAPAQSGEAERPLFRRKIALPKYLLSSTRRVSASQEQQNPGNRNRGLIPRSLAQLMHFEATRVEDLAKELLNLHPQHDHMSRATREAYIGQQCQTLAKITNFLQRCDALPTIKVVLTPGLVLPCHLYQGVVYQLVCYSTKPGELDTLLDEENFPLSPHQSPQAPRRDAQLLVLASGGEYRHLLQRFRPPKQFLRFQLLFVHILNFFSYPLLAFPNCLLILLIIF